MSARENDWCAKYAQRSACTHAQTDSIVAVGQYAPKKVKMNDTDPVIVLIHMHRPWSGTLNGRYRQNIEYSYTYNYIATYNYITIHMAPEE